MATEKRPDAALFKGMTVRQVDKFATRIHHAATLQDQMGQHDTSQDLDDVYWDLAVAYRDKRSGK